MRCEPSFLVESEVVPFFEEVNIVVRQQAHSMDNAAVLFLALFFIHHPRQFYEKSIA